METKKDVSYGIIPIRRINDKWEIFLIHQYSRIGNNSYWVFPKGHQEEGETSKETAIRELMEETGMVAEKIIDDPVFTTQYNFTYEGVKIEKTVQFFIGIVTDYTCSLDGDEVKEAGWYSIEDVDERLDYQNTKQIFKEARQFIEKFNPL